MLTIGTSSHLEEVKRLIIAGFGFGPLPIHVVEDDVRAGRLWRLPPYDGAPMVDVHLVHDRSARRRPGREHSARRTAPGDCRAADRDAHLSLRRLHGRARPPFARNGVGAEMPPPRSVSAP